MLFAKDEAARVGCRDVTNRYYCTMEEAQAALESCADRLSPEPARVASETVTADCRKSGEIYPTIESCAAPVAKHCGFYSACLERALPCGERGYALGFGDLYCNAFRNAPMSERGNTWAMGVMGCLQRVLVPSVQTGSFTSGRQSEDTCQSVLEEAFESHPACYTREEDSLCFLPPSDVLDVVKVIGARELMTSRTRAQMGKTVGICTKRIAVRIARATGRELEELRELARVFKDLARDFPEILLSSVSSPR